MAVVSAATTAGFCAHSQPTAVSPAQQVHPGNLPSTRARDVSLAAFDVPFAPVHAT